MVQEANAERQLKQAGCRLAKVNSRRSIVFNFLRPSSEISTLTARLCCVVGSVAGEAAPGDGPRPIGDGLTNLGILRSTFSKNRWRISDVHCGGIPEVGRPDIYIRIRTMIADE
jgi:hypothetical protein